MESLSGLGKKEGILAFTGFLGSAIVAIIGLRRKPLFAILYIGLFGLFHYIYAKRLCSSCEKLCPVNPSGNFWKVWF